jgi:sugar phosphate isomerase/epimerase
VSLCINPRFAPATRLLWHSGVLGALDMIRQAGFGASEVWAQHLWESNVTPEEVYAKANNLELRVSLHAPSYDLNPLSSNPEIRAISRHQVLASLETAARIGANMVVVHPGHLSSTTDDVEVYWERLEDFVHDLNSSAAMLGVQVGIEGMEKKKLQFVTDLESLARLAGILEKHNLEHIGITLDIAHAGTLGEPQAFIEHTPSVIHAHLSDSSPGKTHALLNEGDLGLKKLVPKLLSRFDGLIAIEGRLAADEARALKIARDFLKHY